MGENLNVAWLTLFCNAHHNIKSSWRSLQSRQDLGYTYIIVRNPILLWRFYVTQWFHQRQSVNTWKDPITIFIHHQLEKSNALQTFCRNRYVFILLLPNLEEKNMRCWLGKVHPWFIDQSKEAGSIKCVLSLFTGFLSLWCPLNPWLLAIICWPFWTVIHKNWDS